MVSDLRWRRWIRRGIVVIGRCGAYGRCRVVVVVGVDIDIE
ncbi:unnamed protein product [Anisakis simplex]|uniref:Uncharacterized protein n=1 Tax=Anisakis simplex TaxID=6269 RepID=A0A3P6P387_ANISI|nr:unnamed protein product [Anisakis simplex]